MLKYLSKSYKLIVLLFYLCKILTKIIIKWFKDLALKNNFISLLYFEVIRRYLAINTILRLIHNIEKA